MLTLLLLQQDQMPLLTVRLILALVCVIVASSLALGVCVGLMRRINTIAPPPAPPTEPHNDERGEHA